MAWYDRFFTSTTRYARFDHPPEPRSPLDVSNEMVRLIHKIPVTDWEDMSNKLGMQRRTYAVKVGIALFALTTDELIMWDKATDAFASKAATETWNIKKSSLVRLFHSFVDEEQKISRMRFEKLRKEADKNAEGILGRGVNDPAYDWL